MTDVGWRDWGTDRGRKVKTAPDSESYVVSSSQLTSQDYYTLELFIGEVLLDMTVIYLRSFPGAG